jgi:macrolide-specific efflux system membrane fusion protein
MSGLRRSFLIFLPLAVAVAGVLGWQLMAARGEDAPRPNLVAAAQGDIEDVVTALGALQPLQYVDVGTQVSGQLQRIMVQIGSNVAKGDQLAQIDPTVYQARVAGNEAQLLVLKAQVADKQAQRTLADHQMRRQKDLLAARATSQDAFDIADANLKQIAAQIDALQAQIKQTEATLEADRANLGYTKIFAPMAGTVVDILARQGQTLNANQSAPLILRIADLDTMTVQAQVSEADVAKLEVGMSAYFTTLGKPDRRRFGKLRQILPTPTVVNNVVLYYVLFDAQNKERDLLPQMSAQVFFVVGSAKATTIVPVGALRLVSARRGERKYTVQVMENGALAERPVEVGVMNRTHAEIKSGLKVGDQVALSETPSPSRPGNRGGGPRFGPRI